MKIYNDFAYVYDLLTEDVEYERRADYLQKLFDMFLDTHPTLIADIGCGTGTMCNILSERGYDMIGIDQSEAMLNVAKNKSEDKNILYSLQSMTDFELYGTVDVFLSLLDSVNYLTEDGDLEKLFSLVKNYLNPGGIFIFDINTPYKFQNILAQNIYTFENDDIFYIWENDFDGKICEFYLNFFVRNETNEYSRITEQHFERCYSFEEIENEIKKQGLKIMGIFSDLTYKKYNNNDERVYFIVKKD